jgi:hypothetical protein
MRRSYTERHGYLLALEKRVIRNLPRNYKIALVFMRIISRKGEDSAHDISSTPTFVIDIYAQCQESEDYG